MHIVVTGTEGQVARALVERSHVRGGRVTSVGRPDLDLSRPETILPSLQRAAPDVIVSAAAYTAVDLAETESKAAWAVNGQGAAAVAAAASALDVPVIHLSTDYVFDGTSNRPYRETDPVRPLGAYGQSKLAGETAVAGATADHAILRTAWVYSPFGKNFVKTMLRLARDRDEIAVVADQWGSPTSALDIADGIMTVAQNLVERRGEQDLRGVFHIAGTGFTNWAELAVFVFEQSARLGGPSARVRPISTAEYPTPAKRPANSRLDCTKLAVHHGVKLPDWQSSAAACVRRLIETDRF